MHVTRRDYADERAATPNGKSDVQEPPVVGLTKRMKSRLALRMSDICFDDQGLIEEYLLSFCLADRVFIKALAFVSAVPIKAPQATEVNHECIV